MKVKVQIAPNGWPGIFIPGDSALSTAAFLRVIADNIPAGESSAAMAKYLRSVAAALESCAVGPDFVRPDWPSRKLIRDFQKEALGGDGPS